MRELYTRSVLVAVEGIDGAGKTTQVQMLAHALREAGEEPVVSKEPTNGHWGQKIKESASNGRLPLQDELHAFVNDRREHVERIIQPALDAGRVVILDRYFYSTIAYQGSRGADVAKLKADMEARFPIPDVVFLLDLDPFTAVHRISNSRKETPNEFERVEALAHVREVFNSLEGPICKIEGNIPIAAVHVAVMRAFVYGCLKAKRCVKTYGCDEPNYCAFAQGGACNWWNLSRLLLSRSVEAVGG